MNVNELLISPFFITLFSTGLVFAIVGVILSKYPPKKINSLYGYRTGSSMKNQDRWDFAQVYSGKLMVKSGILLVLIGLLDSMVPSPHGIWISLVAVIATTILLIIFTEKAIGKKFSA